MKKPQPLLIAVGGQVGTGKSTLARRLSAAFGAVWLRTDEIRLKEFSRFRKPDQRFDDGIYAPKVSAMVYRTLERRAEALLARGRPVVCDGMFGKASGRRRLRMLAKRRGALFHFFECRVPRRVALERLAARAASGTDISEAGPEHYDRLAAGYEPVTGWPASVWTRLSDNRKPQATFRAALAVLRKRQPTAPRLTRV